MKPDLSFLLEIPSWSWRSEQRARDNHSNSCCSIKRRSSSDWLIAEQAEMGCNICKKHTKHSRCHRAPKATNSVCLFLEVKSILVCKDRYQKAVLLKLPQMLLCANGSTAASPNCMQTSIFRTAIKMPLFVLS